MGEAGNQGPQAQSAISRESPLRVQETPLASHPHAQRNASRRRGERQQRRLFFRWNPSLKRSHYKKEFGFAV
jgi:hypothetical protein